MAENIYDAIKPFYYLLKIFGFACFTIKGKITDGKIKSTIFDILTLLAYCSFLNWTVIRSIYGFGNIRSHFIIYVCVSASSVMIMNSFIQRHSFWNILRHLHSFDESIKNLGYVINHKKHHKLIWIYITVNILLIITSLYFLLRDRPFEAHIVTVYMSAIIIFIQFGSFNLWLIIVKSRQNQLNSFLKNVFLLQNKGIKHQRCKELSNIFIRSSNLHQILNETIDSINTCFALVCLTCFFIYFVFLILIVFSIYHAIYSKHGTVTPLMLATYCYFFLFFFGYVMGILSASSVINGEV